MSVDGNLPPAAPVTQMAESPAMPFSVKTDREPCKECGQSGNWVILDQEGTQLSVSYAEEDDAEYYCDLLNNAYHDGTTAAAKLENASRALIDVYLKRRRQIEKHGYSAAGDDSYTDFELLKASIAYMSMGRNLSLRQGIQLTHQAVTKEYWPKGWDESKFIESNNYRACIVNAAALLIAEIERFDRAEGK